MCAVWQALLTVLHALAPQQVRVRSTAAVQVSFLSAHFQAQGEHEVSHRLCTSGADAGVPSAECGCVVRKGEDS